MSKLRSNKWKCKEIIDGKPCGEVAAYRCNACQERFCFECWDFHLHMTVIEIDGIPTAKHGNMHGKENDQHSEEEEKEIHDNTLNHLLSNST